MEQYLRRANPGEWITAEGLIINITLMTNSHLSNCIKMLEMKKLEKHDKYKELVEEARRRGWNLAWLGEEFEIGGAL